MNRRDFLTTTPVALAGLLLARHKAEDKPAGILMKLPPSSTAGLHQTTPWTGRRLVGFGQTPPDMTLVSFSFVKA